MSNGERRSPPVGVGDRVWFKYFPRESDRGSRRFRRLTGKVESVLEGGMLVVVVNEGGRKGKVPHHIPCNAAVHAGSVVERQHGHQYGMDLVGSRVRVYWPLDDEFYVGMVRKWHCVKGMHEVLYDDGEVWCVKLGGSEFPYWEVVQ